MSDHHSYQKLEIVGSSKNSIEEAINNAIAQCHKTNNNLDWFEVTETRGHIVDGRVAHFQVTLKIGYKIEGS